MTDPALNKDSFEGSRSNQDKLNDLQAGAPATVTRQGNSFEASGPLPWDGKPVETAPRQPSSKTAQGTSSTVEGSGQANLPAPGVYPGQLPGELFYWDGTEWDPRPIAPIWTRVWCWVVDSLIAFAFAFAVAVLVLIPLSVVAPPDSGAYGALSVLVLAVMFVTYFAFGYRAWGRTPGMMLGRLYVVKLETGEKLGWGPAYLRAFILCLGQTFGILAIIWLAIASSNARKQGPHDSAAHSIVLRRAA